MNEVNVVRNTETIRSCNGCYARNFDSNLNAPGERVDLLFEVRIGNQCSCLCRNCLNRLIGAAVTINAVFE